MAPSREIYALLDRDSIYDSLFGHCSPATIYRLGSTCRFAHRTMKEYTKRAFDINKHFSRFFTDPVAFRALQERTLAVVSGSNALQFLERTVYPSSDMDIYVSSRHAAEVCNWIVTQGGKNYKFIPSASQLRKGIDDVPMALLFHKQTNVIRQDIDESASRWDFYDSNRIRVVLNFISMNGENKKVQVLLTHNTPMDCILSFHSTVVMNAITHVAAYALYPKGTFEERTMLPCDTREINHDPGLTKYKARGWKVTHTVGDPSSNPKQAFIFGKRRLGDASTWTIPFDELLGTSKHTENIPVGIDPITLNTFSLTNNWSRNTVEMRFSTLRPNIFKNRYTACPEAIPKIKFWLEMLKSVVELSGNPRGSEPIMLDEIIVDWNADLFRECTCICIPGADPKQFISCPAFLTSFNSFAPLAISYLKLAANLDSCALGRRCSSAWEQVLSDE